MIRALILQSEHAFFSLSTPSRRMMEMQDCACDQEIKSLLIRNQKKTDARLSSRGRLPISRSSPDALSRGL